jgi:ADP-ribosylglycohydrolase
MPTQLMSRAEIARRFGSITGFTAADDDHPIAASMPAGSITDDTEQALLLARVMIDSGHRTVDPAGFARRLAEWEDEMRARGSLDLLGPSTRAAVAALLAGAPAEETGRSGTTNGAAMRIAPLGIAVDPHDLPHLVALVRAAGQATHDTGTAIAGAAAVAAAISAGIEGDSREDAFGLAIAAARLGAASADGSPASPAWIAGADVAARIEWAIGLADEPLDRFLDMVGTSLATQESVPAAFGLVARFDGDGWQAALAAANGGGDTDTIAAIAGAVAGALGHQYPADAIETVSRLNGLDLDAVADGLLILRDSASD